MQANSNKKIVIITYYWPPSGGSGVQRWLKFVKYLHREGWEPIVFTPENPSFTTQDPSLLKDVHPSIEVLRLPIWEPYEFFGKVASLFGKKNLQQADFITTGRKSFFQKLTGWIRGNFFIPDARIFWVKPAVGFLQDFIRVNQIEKIITTGPPHSIHLVGLKLKKKDPSLKWIADFRDPWSEWDLLDTLSLTSLARKRHRALEKKVLQTADRVITIAPYHVRRFEVLGGRPVALITNGFDEEDFSSIEKVRAKQYTIRHIGIVDELRDPRPVMEAIKNLCLQQPGLRSLLCIEFIGNVNASFREWIAADAALAEVTRFVSYLPHHELLKVFGSTDLQLLVLAHTAIAPGNLPGKFFEYLASGNPILAVGPVDGDAAGVLKDAQAGKIFERDDRRGMEDFLLQKIGEWTKGKVNQSTRTEPYTRRNLTRQLVELLESI